MSGDKVPSGTSPLSVPLVPSVKAASISFQRQKRKSHHVEFWNSQEKEISEYETEGEGRLAKPVMEAEGHRSGVPQGQGN